jgi:4-amino-4-deoxy-L-arabinose transferase-like glycosyltransferase
MPRRPFESRIQDLVYNLDVGFGLRLIQGSLVVLTILLVLLLYTATQFRGLDNAEAMDYAQLGRNLLVHKRFVTQNIRPLSLAHFRQRGGQSRAQIAGHPDLFHPPLYPALLAAGFGLGGGAFSEGWLSGTYPPEQWVIVPLNHLFVLLNGVLLFGLGRRLFGPRVAGLSLAAYFLSRLVWQDSISGTGLPVVSFFALLSFYAALRAIEKRSEKPDARVAIVWLAVSAIACGLAILTRYAAVALLPGVALFIGWQFGRRAWRWAAVHAAIALLVIAPWLARNTLVSGNPFGLALHTALYDSRLSEGDQLERTVEPSRLGLVPAARALQIKWMSRMAELSDRRLREYGNGWLFPLFLSAFFFRFSRREVHALRWCAALSLFLMTLLAGVFSDSVFRLLNIFWPVVIVYGMAFFLLLLDRLRLGLRLLEIGVTGVVLFFTALPLIFALLPPRTGVPYPPYYPPFIRHVSDLLEPHEVMCTDMPWAVAWYGNRAAIHLPPSLDQFYRLNDYYQRISGLYLTTLTRDRPYTRMLKTHPTYRTWFPILEMRVPSDFPLSHGFQLNNFDQMFLTDRPRWLERK